MKKVAFGVLALALVFGSCANPAGGSALSGQQEAAKVSEVMAKAYASPDAVYTPKSIIYDGGFSIVSSVTTDDGKSYQVSGSFEMTLEMDDNPDPYPMIMTMHVVTTGFSIKGPDLDKTYTMDYTSTTTLNEDSSGSIAITGYMDGQFIDFTMSF